jgi:hypothetical protein
MQSTSASKIAPTVTFTGAPASAGYKATFALQTTTNASTTAVLSASGVCTLSGGAVTITSGTGTCSLQATWAADSNYSSAILTQSTSASKIAPTATFTGAPALAAYQSKFTVATTTNASTTPAISASGVCSISGSTVTMTSGAGTCSLQAVWAADSNYSAITLTQTATATPIAQTVTITPISNPTATQSYTLTATSTTGGAPAFVSTTPAICNVSGSKVSVTATGSCTVTVSVPATANYLAGSAQYTFTAIAPFTITPNPAKEQINLGVLASFTLQINSQDSFSGSIKLTCSGGPAGATCFNLPMTVLLLPNGQALAVSGILFPLNTAPGTYTMTFTGASGSLTTSATAQFTVQ